MIHIHPQPRRRWFDGTRTRLGAAVAAWRERALTRHELDRLAACGELEHVLADVGLSPGQVPLMIKHGRAAHRRLAAMLERLGMPQTPRPTARSMREIEWQCTLCDQRRRCGDWLASGRSDDGYHAFCPNAAELDRMRASAARAAPVA